MGISDIEDRAGRLTRMQRELTEVRDEMIEALDFVPPDDGNDDETKIEVSLADLRRLVTAGWRSHSLAGRAIASACESQAQVAIINRCLANVPLEEKSDE